MQVVRPLPSVLAVALLAAACWHRTPTPPVFKVLRTSPDLGSDSEPILLNDSITIYFSDTLQALSVTPDSVSLVDEEDRPVRGSLRVGSNWAAFQPEPPLTRELTDGSLRPGGRYRLFVAGYPRHDAVRASDGRRLAAAVAFHVRVAGLGYRPPGLPAPLRPPMTELPFVLRNQDPLPQMVPANAPRLRLRFTLPVLPTTAVAEAFEVLLMRTPLETLVPRSVRVVPSRLPDEITGSTVEIDLGGLMRQDGSGHVSLKPSEVISVRLKTGANALRDYWGNTSLPGAPPWYWVVAAGSSIALAEWTADDGAIAECDPAVPGFEVRAGVMRPRVRVEAGDGSLGIFRPQRDTTLRPGEPFDRGDGEIVTSRGAVFPFMAVDIPAGVSVTVDARSGPVQILCCADLRIAGAVKLLGSAQPMQGRYLQVVPVRDLLEGAPVAMVAAGDVHVRGTVTAQTTVAAESTVLTLATAGRMHLNGALPFNTILALEAEGPAVHGVLGQTKVVWATFTYGIARGAEFVASGFTSWCQLPWDREGGVFQADADPELRIGWQSAPADIHRRRERDLRRGLARSQPVADQDRIPVEPGAFVRFELTAQLIDSRPPPRVRELRIVDR